MTGMDKQIFINGILREWWSSETRTVTAYDEHGEVTLTRPYTPDENAAADAAAQAEEDARLEEERRQIQAAIVDATVALMEIAHTDGEVWTQPIGVHNAYKLGVVVEHADKTWENITHANVWEPGVSGWREVVTEGYPTWTQPTGAHDAYPLGAQVTHNGQDWESTAAGNIWEPGVFGWSLI